MDDILKKIQCYHPTRESLREVVANKNGTMKSEVLKALAGEYCATQSECESCPFRSGGIKGHCALYWWR